MREIQNVRQIAGEARRRWFTNTAMDLIVWVNDDSLPTGFQLCYDKGRFERAITWTSVHGFSHMAIDDGERLFGLGYKATPVLVAGGSIDIQMINTLFHSNDAHLPNEIAHFVSDKLSAFSARHQDIGQS